MEECRNEADAASEMTEKKVEWQRMGESNKRWQSIACIGNYHDMVLYAAIFGIPAFPSVPYADF